MFAYIKALMVDIKDGVADVLEGLEQSRRWDLLKALEAKLEGVDTALAKLEADVHIQDAKAVTREQGLTRELEEARKEAGRANDQIGDLNAYVEKLRAEVAALELAAVKPADPVAAPVEG